MDCCSRSIVKTPPGSVAAAVFLLFLTSCAASAPWSEDVSVKTIGKGNWQAGGGYNDYADFTTMFGYGVTDDLDVGLELDLERLGIWVKHGIVQSKNDGYNLSAKISAGTYDEANVYCYGQLQNGLRWKVFEPFLSLRFNYVFNDESSHYDFERVRYDAADFYYMNLGYGLTLWPAEWVGISVYGNAAFPLGSNRIADDPFTTFGGNVNFKW